MLVAARLLMMLTFVGMTTHCSERSLPSYAVLMQWTAIFFGKQLIMTKEYIQRYGRTGSMALIFPLHLIADASLVLFA